MLVKKKQKTPFLLLLIIFVIVFYYMLRVLTLVDANNENRTIKFSTTDTASINTYTIERAPSIVDGFEDNIYA